MSGAAMSAFKKFTFDTSFDDEALAEEAAQTEEPALTEADVERARADGVAEGKRLGFDEGRAAGVAETLEGAERLLAQMLERIAEQLGGLAQADHARIDATTGEAVLIARAVAERVLSPILDERAADTVEAVLRDALPIVVNEPRLVVRLAEDAIDALRPRLEDAAQHAGFAGQLILIGEPSIGNGDCRIEWADGGIDRSRAAIWQEIDRRVAEFARHFGAGGDAPDEDAENAEERAYG